MSNHRLITGPVETEAEVEVYLDDFSDEDLIDEARARGMIVFNPSDEMRDNIEALYRMILANDDPKAIVLVAYELYREALGREL